MSACSRTMRAYCRAWPAAGTDAARPSTAAWPPAASRLPSDRSRSETVSTSIGSLSEYRPIIAPKISR